MYSYKVELQDSKGAVSTYRQTIEFNLPPREPSDPPTFIKSLNDVFKTLGKNFKIYLPDAISKTGRPFTKKIDFGSAESFASYNENENAIFIDGVLSFAGNF